MISNATTRLLLACGLLLASGCMSDDGQDISRPADQGFGGADREEETVVMTHRFTAIGLAGSHDQPVTATLNGNVDVDAAPNSYRIVLACDGAAFPADPGLGGGSADGSLMLRTTDQAGTTAVQVVAVEFNP
ncbi:MAG: hypothetical protein J0M02_04505 [Planctomycetes bacterium]|nr:hypothetical protein [Planctomycetota bacterium]